jgi:hypothetical protein
MEQIIRSMTGCSRWAVQCSQIHDNWRLVDPVLWLAIPKRARRFQWNYTRAGREITQRQSK